MSWLKDVASARQGKRLPGVRALTHDGQPVTSPRCKAAFGKLDAFPMGVHGGGTHARQDLRHYAAR